MPNKILLLNSMDMRGGAARAVYRLHQGLLDIGVNSHMLVQEKISDDFSIIGPKNKFLKGLSKIRSTLDGIPLMQYKKRKPTSFSPAFLPEQMADEIKLQNADIAHLNWIVGGFIRIETLKKIDIPIVWTIHDMWPFTGGCNYSGDCTKYLNSCGSCYILGSNNECDLSRKVWSRKQRAWRGLNLTLVAPSKWMADCTSRSSLFYNMNVNVIPNCINTDLYKPVDKHYSREVLGLPQDKKIVLFGAINATHDKRKGFHILIEALQKLPKGNMELAVFGASKSSLNEINLGIKIHNIGHLNDDLSLNILYSAADVMVVPSIQESFGQTAVEAMACGIPVTAFGATGLLDIVEHKQNGYLAKPYDSVDLANGIVWILENSERWNDLSKNARLKVESEYESKKIAAKYSELYNEIINYSKK